MKTFVKYISPCILSLCLLGCNQTTENSANLSGNKYAQGFSLIENTNYTEAIIYTPWKDSCVMQRFFLVKDTDVQTPSNGIRLHIPLKSIAATSCTQVGFLSALHSLPAIKGMANPELLYTPLPHSDWEDIGNAMHPQLERILLIQPEALLLTVYQGENRLQRSIKDRNITPIYINEWTEKHPLARAEWIRFLGALFDKKEMADSIFATVEQRYMQLAGSAAKQFKSNPTILTGNNFRGTWYMPTGNTYMGTLFADAGTDYYYKDRTEGKSLPLSEEEVLLHFQDAQIWVGCNALSLKELADENSKCAMFKAFQTGRVFNFKKRTTPSGGNDFWETGTVHPELILNDLIHICHPEQYNNDDNELYFSKQLQ